MSAPDQGAPPTSGTEVGGGLPLPLVEALKQAVSENAQNPILQGLLAAATEFLTGEPVKDVIEIPTEQVTFTAKNPFGVIYDFTFGLHDGKIVLKGTPQ